MNQIHLTDEALTQAAASVRRAFLDSLPPPSQCEHEFSDTFRMNMKRLLSRYDLRRKVSTAARHAAMFFLALLLSACVWLGVDAEARAAFSAWARELYEEHIVYRFFGQPSAQALPAYRITWLPDGYEKLMIHDDEERYAALYQAGDDTASRFTFEYTFMRSGKYIHVDLDEADCVHEIMDLNGVQADFYQAVDSDEANMLFWFNKDADLVFMLNGSLEESVMLHIAQSIILTDSTN